MLQVGTEAAFRVFIFQQKTTVHNAATLTGQISTLTEFFVKDTFAEILLHQFIF